MFISVSIASLQLQVSAPLLFVFSLISMFSLFPVAADEVTNPAIGSSPASLRASFPMRMCQALWEGRVSQIMLTNETI